MLNFPVMALNAALTGLAAVLGVFCRYAVYRVAVLQAFPVFWATFAVNALGSFGLGFALVYLEARLSPPAARALLVPVGVGFFGAFTTFSAFSKDLFELLATRHYVFFIAASLQVPAGLLGYFAGHRLAHWLGG